MSMGAIAVSSIGAGPDEMHELRIIKYFTLSGFVLTAVLCLGITPVARILYGSTSSHIVGLSIILSIFLPIRFLNFSLSSFLLASGRSVERLKIVIASVVFNVALNLAMDGWAFAAGAAWATVITEVGVTVLFMQYLHGRSVRRGGLLVLGISAVACLVQILDEIPDIPIPVVTGITFVAGLLTVLLTSRTRGVKP
jgi:O-antigen/teichoic acid export membrane protein